MRHCCSDTARSTNSSFTKFFSKSRFVAVMTVCLHFVLLLLGIVHAERPPRVLTILPHSDLQLENREAITIVYSTSIIALGQDWEEVPESANPFKFQLPSGTFSVPGKVRW
jgi:hypothetical protein